MLQAPIPQNGSTVYLPYPWVLNPQVVDSLDAEPVDMGSRLYLSPAHSALASLLFLEYGRPQGLCICCVSAYNALPLESIRAHSLTLSVNYPFSVKPFLPTHPLPPLPTPFPVLFFSVTLTTICNTVTIFYMFAISPN